MTERGKPTEHERRDWVVILVILLIGFLCVILAGSWAIRFAPVWKLDTNMRSNLDPDSDFLTNRPSGFFAPLDPSILTQPVWINVFLTPGASFPTRTPVPPTNTPLPTITLPIPSNTPTRIPPSPTSTLPYFPPPTRTSIPNTPLPPTSTSAPNTPVTPPTAVSADLSITKTDNATHYVADATKTYVIVVANNSPSSVTGATVTDAFTNPNILPGSVTWSCSGTGGGNCTANGSGDINDLVNLPAGASVTYIVDITVVSSPSGPLENTATVTAPSGVTDPVPGNNFSTDTDLLITVDPHPGEISLPPDNTYYELQSGGTLTLNITTTVSGNPGPDLVFYEFLNGSYVYMDLVQIQIGDGSNWYTVFYWGDEIRDTNTNMDYALLPCPPDTEPYPPGCPPGGSLYEPDERQIPPIYFYPYTPVSRGVAIDIDLPFIPQGTYPYIRFISPPGDANGLEIDAIEVLP